MLMLLWIVFVVMYKREGVEFYRYCFETVVFMNRVAK